MPKTIVVISGKRKTGKDYIVNEMEKCWDHQKGTLSVLHLSEPLKSHFALQHNLDVQELLSSGPFKEIYRREMITYGEKMRQADPFYWCNLAVHGQISPYWIIPDCRRQTDVDFFLLLSKELGSTLIRVRIEADTVVRQSRGFSFCTGVDDAESECGLDNYPDWDMKIVNNGNDEMLKAELHRLHQLMLQ
eukprot:TRINITY_DN8602_c0_g2_i9.p1 TRINITY_DN8602_c0_g2~~TRINITY_DN8602_c0_g2_i9.p1  ORF type:complete len:190 (-),score=24.28 TRINITY_DN8602_c0_g2_i9:240-809(-)